MKVGYAEIAILSLYLALVRAVNAVTLRQARCCQYGRRWTTVTVPQVECDIAGSKRRCWLREKTAKCLWQEASTFAKDNRTAHLTACS